MPLSGGPAAAFGPVKDGFQLYLDYGRAQQGLLPGYTITADIRDDQYDATQTPGVVDALIDDGVDFFSGIIGSPNNLAVRDTLNEECIPQLAALTGSPAWGRDRRLPVDHRCAGALRHRGVDLCHQAQRVEAGRQGRAVLHQQRVR